MRGEMSRCDCTRAPARIGAALPGLAVLRLAFVHRLACSDQLRALVHAPAAHRSPALLRVYVLRPCIHALLCASRARSHLSPLRHSSRAHPCCSRFSLRCFAPALTHSSSPLAALFPSLRSRALSALRYSSPSPPISSLAQLPSPSHCARPLPCFLSVPPPSLRSASPCSAPLLTLHPSSPRVHPHLLHSSFHTRTLSPPIPASFTSLHRHSPARCVLSRARYGRCGPRAFVCPCAPPARSSALAPPHGWHSSRPRDDLLPPSHLTTSPLSSTPQRIAVIAQFSIALLLVSLYSTPRSHARNYPHALARAHNPPTSRSLHYAVVRDLSFPPPRYHSSIPSLSPPPCGFCRPAATITRATL